MRGVAGAWLAALALAGCSGGGSSPDMVVGSTTSTQTSSLPAATLATPPPEPVPPTPSGDGLKGADGRPYAGSIAFSSTVPVPSDLTFVLVVGSDARPREDIRRTNADSIHLLAVNPRTLEGTVMGFPRDAWVEIPGRGNGKITSALAQGGPGLLVDTVRRLTGLPVQYYVLTGFEGLASMVDALGGVDVFVDRRMNDRFSGARFERGWHHFNGAQALAFTRNRNDAPNGDFGRSENQGTLVLAALSKMRAEVGDAAAVRRWVEVLTRHAVLDVDPDRLLGLATLGRSVDPARLRNVVVPGRIGDAGRQSVVFLSEEAARLFIDLRPDAVIGGSSGEPARPATTAPPATSPPTTATTSPPLVATTSTTTSPPPAPTPPPINLLP